MRAACTLSAVALIAALSSPAPAQRAPVLRDSVIRRADSVVIAFMAAHHVPGLSVAIGLDQRLVWSKGYGLADLEDSIRVTRSSMFRTASIGKPMTATAVMQLWEQGKLVTGDASTLSAAQIVKLAKIPTLVVFGDHLGDVPASTANWPAALASCQKYVDAINQAGGDATMLHLPDAGVFGNSHMMFQDKNNLQVGDMVLAWIDQHVGGKPGHHK
jgi:pimeloyl-ACP methyl ester carboxylesterase